MRINKTVKGVPNYVVDYKMILKMHTRDSLTGPPMGYCTYRTVNDYWPLVTFYDAVIDLNIIFEKKVCTQNAHCYGWAFFVYTCSCFSRRRKKRLKYLIFFYSLKTRIYIVHHITIALLCKFKTILLFFLDEEQSTPRCKGIRR